MPRTRHGASTLKPGLVGIRRNVGGENNALANFHLVAGANRREREIPSDMRTFFVCLLTLAPSIALAAAEQQPNAPEDQMSAIAAAASFNLDTISATRLRADPDVSNAISRVEICNTISAAAQAHDLPVAFFTSLIWQESAFRTAAVSPVGAQGVAQFMPRVAQAMGLENPFDPREALPMSARLLRTLYNQFGNLGLAAAAYNAGPRLVLNWLEKKNAKLPKETRDYVERITGRKAEDWRTAMASVEFRAPAGTRCVVDASRAHRQGNEIKIVDMATNIPLPRSRPSAGEMITHEIAVADAGQKPRRAKAVTSAANPVEQVITAVAKAPARIAKAIDKTVRAIEKKQAPLRLESAARAKPPRVAKAKAPPKAKVASGKRVHVAKAD